MSETKNEYIKKGIAVALTAASMASIAAAVVNSETNAAPNNGPAASAGENKEEKLPATPATRDYAALEGVFTASTGTVNKGDLVDWTGDTAYKPGVADAYWLQVDLGQSRDISSVSIKFLQNANVDGFVQYTNDDGASKDPASKAWTDFSRLDGASGAFNAKAGKVVKARFIRVLVNKTSVANNAPAGTKAEDVAGVADFQVNAGTVYAQGFETKGLEKVSQTHYGDSYEFTTKATTPGADVNYDTTGTSPAFQLTKGKTDADGTTHWTLKVVASTAGTEQPVVIKNTIIKEAGAAQDIVGQKVSSWAYAKSVALSATEGNQTLFIGDTANDGKGASLAYAVAGEDGQPASQDVEIVSDNPDVVAINAVNVKDDRTGKETTRYYAQGKSVGTAHVTVTAKDSRKGTVVNHVLNFESQYQSATGFTDIKAPSEITLGAEGGNKITAKVTPEDTADQNITFASSDEKTLTVDADGNLTPHVEGLGDGDSKTVTVTATAPVTTVGETPKTFSVDITVKRPAVASVVLETGLKDGTITLGDDTEKGLAVNATVSPEFANTGLTWASSNEKVATVDNAGNVKFTGEPGFVAITATSAHGAGGASVVGTAGISVVRPAVTAISAYDAADKDMKPVSKLDWVAGEGRTVDLNVAATPKYASNDVYWITGNAAVASVDATTGVVKQGSEAGTTTITAVSTENGKVQARVDVNVAKPAASKITVTLPDGVDASNVETGSAFRLGVDVEPAGADADVVWSSSDPTVATVSENGIVTALKAGKATITATAKADGGTGSVATFGADGKAVSGSVDLNVVESSADVLKSYEATYTGKDGDTVKVAGFDASKDGEFTLPAGTDLSTLKIAKATGEDAPAVDVKTVYVGKDGNEVEDAKDATGATITITDGKTTTTQKFTLDEDAAAKTWTVTLKNNNGAPDSTYKVKDGEALKLISAPVWSGHEFLGVYTTEDFQDGTQFKFGDTKVNSDLTLYVKWSGTDAGNTGDDDGSDTSAFTADELAALKDVNAEYEKDGAKVPVDGFDPTADGSYTINGDISSLRVFGFPDNWDADIAYSRDGKEAKSADADAAVVTLKAPSGASVRYSFTEEPAAADNAANKGADSTTVAADQKGAGDTAGNADKTLAKTGAAAGIVAAISAGLASAGLFIKRRLSH